jgi:hypothetical protein
VLKLRVEKIDAETIVCDRRVGALWEVAGMGHIIGKVKTTGEHTQPAVTKWAWAYKLLKIKNYLDGKVFFLNTSSHGNPKSMAHYGRFKRFRF